MTKKVIRLVEGQIVAVQSNGLTTVNQGGKSNSPQKSAKPKSSTRTIAHAHHSGAVTYQSSTHTSVAETFVPAGEPFGRTASSDDAMQQRGPLAGLFFLSKFLTGCLANVRILIRVSKFINQKGEVLQMKDFHLGWIALGAVTASICAVAIFARLSGPRKDSDYQILVYNITQMVPPHFEEFEMLVARIYESNVFNEYWSSLNTTSQDLRKKRELVLNCLFDAPPVLGESHSKAKVGGGADHWLPITFSEDPDEAKKLRESIIRLAVEADIRLRFRRQR